MKRNIKKYLEDIVISIEDIEKYSFGMKYVNEIEDNQMLFDALCRRFAIIGEAVFQLNKLDPSIQITDKQKIIALRHIIVHDYDLVTPTNIFIIIKKNLPLLKLEVQNLFQTLKEDTSGKD